MKSILLSFLLLSTASAFSQSKSDTVNRYLRPDPKHDTVQVETLMYKGENNVVKWCSPGYYILEFTVSTTDGKAWQRVNMAPSVLGVLNDKKKPVQPIK